MPARIIEPSAFSAAPRAVGKMKPVAQAIAVRTFESDAGRHDPGSFVPADADRLRLGFRFSGAGESALVTRWDPNLDGFALDEPDLEYGDGGVTFDQGVAWHEGIMVGLT